MDQAHRLTGVAPSRPSPLIVAGRDGVLLADPEEGVVSRATGLDEAVPICLARDPGEPDHVLCGTRDSGVYRSRDAGRNWRPAGLAGRRIMSLAVCVADGSAWAGGEPSRVWRSTGPDSDWEETSDLAALPSSGEWAFPPRPETHHVRWIACHPHDPRRLWVAIEAGALVGTDDAGDSWVDRVPGGPYDTHELAVHPRAPERLNVAAGDGPFTSPDGGRTWTEPRAGLDIGYMRSIAIDPGDARTVLISGASGPRSTYIAGRSDGRVYRRVGDGDWVRVEGVWPDPPSTIAPLLRAGDRPGELWAADERGVHRSDDAGITWATVARFGSTQSHLTGFVARGEATPAPPGS